MTSGLDTVEVPTCCWKLCQIFPAAELVSLPLENKNLLSFDRTKKELKDSRSGGLPAIEPVKTGARMMISLLRKNGENGSARSRDSRGSKDESSPAQLGDNSHHLKVLPSEVSISSMESDSQESQRRHRRLDEIAEVMTGKLEPLVGDIHGVQDRMNEVFYFFGFLH